MTTENKGNLGVNKTETAILELGFLFRQQFQSDYGIDAHVEIRDGEDYPTGKLIALQIKTDKSNCTEAEDHYNFNSDYQHLYYWLNHSLPVLIIHYDTKTKKLNWVQLTEDKITRNKNSWSIKIPKNKTLDESSKKELKKIAENIDIQTRKYNILQESLVLMEHLANGNKVCIEFQDWINKSLSIRALKINIYNQNEEIIDSVEWPFDVFPNDLEKGLSKMFPWANIENDIDEDELYDNLKSEYMDTWGIREEEDLSYTDFREWYHEKLESMPKFYPYMNVSNEADLYKLNLTLNDLGESFLELNKYFNSFDEFIR